MSHLVLCQRRRKLRDIKFLITAKTLKKLLKYKKFVKINKFQTDGPNGSSFFKKSIEKLIEHRRESDRLETVEF